MNDPQIALFAPLQAGWSWMVRVLFRPFELRKWFVLGFSAWLAGLASWGGGGGGSGVTDDGGGRELVHSAQEGWDWLSSHGLIVGLLAVGCLVVLALIVLALWVSSRAKFIFLDNVVHDRARIVEPWKKFQRPGDSLFLFRLVVVLLAVPLSLATLGLGIWLAAGPGGWAHMEGLGTIVGAVTSALVGLILLVATLYTFFFLDAFVVPLMYRFELGVLDGWRRFLSLLQVHGLWFLACGLFVFGLGFVALVAIITTGLMTCCLGFVLLALPYIGTVVLLPLIVTYRAFTVAFLAQFEPELRLEPTPAPPSPQLS